MKKYIALIVFSMVVLSCNARGFFFFSTGTEVYQVKELPDNYKIQTADNGEIHVNLGVIYKEFSIFGLPVWNWEVDKYVYLPDNYESLDSDNIVYYKVEYGDFLKIKQIVGHLPEKPELSFWRSYGGKIIFVPLLLFLQMIFFGSGGEDKE